MSVYEAGQARLTIVPDAREFRAKLEADLRKVRAELAVPVIADIARARGEIDRFRAEQEAHAIRVRTEVDRDHLRRSLDTVRGDFGDLGDTLGKALKLDAATVGIGLLPALATGLASVAQALEQVADAGLAVPGILAGVGASAATVALGLSGVKDAWTAVGAAADESGSAQARQAQQVVSATNSLRNAVVDEARAEKDVADARRDARQQLEDLNIATHAGALSEKEAILEANKARRDLAQGRFKDALDRESAELRVQEADQRVVEAKQRNIELQQKVGEANAKGVEGSDRVVAANERLVRSHQAVQAAQASLANVGAGGLADKAAEAMAKLAPNAREFVQAIVDLKPAFKSLEDEDAQNLFAGMGGALKQLAASDLPAVRTGVGSIATAINGDLRQLFSSLGSDSSKGLITRILGDTANADGRVKDAIDPIIHAILTLTATGTSTLPRLATAADHVADRFNRFITAAAGDGRLSKWINDGETAFTHLGEIAIHLGETFHGVTEAVGGNGLLADLDSLTGKLEKFTNSTEGQQKLTKFFQEGREEFHKWEPVIENLGRMLPTVFETAKKNADSFLPIIRSLTDLLAQNPALLETIVGGYLAWETTVKPIGSVFNAVKDLSGLVKTFRDHINDANTAIGKTGTVAKTAAEEVGLAARAEAGAYATVTDAALASDEAIAGNATAAKGRLSRVMGALGAAAGPVGILAAGGMMMYDTLDDQDQRAKAFQHDMANAKTQQERDEIEKRYFGYHLPAQPGTPGGPPAGAPVPPGTPKQLQDSQGQSTLGRTGSMSDQAAWESLAKQGDPMAQWVTAGGSPDEIAKRAQWALAHQDQDKPGWQPPQSYGAGGATPRTAGPLPDGGYHAVIHPDEWVNNPVGRKALGDPFLAAANKGVVDTSLLPHFDVGGPGDQPPGQPGGDVGYGSLAAPNPASLGPATVAPNPMGPGGGAPGMLNNVVNSVASGVQGPIGNAIGFASNAIQQGMSQGQANGSLPSFGGGGFGAGGSSGSSMIPGVWGLLQAGNDPNALMQWGSQTLNWTANFGAKTLSSAAQIGMQGALDAVGLGGSMLSPSNPYNQAAQRTAGFYLGDQSPLKSLMGGSGGSVAPADSGTQSITLGDGSVIQIPTYGTAGPGAAGLGNAVPGATTPTGELIGANPDSRAAALYAGRAPGDVTPEALAAAGFKPLYGWGNGSSAAGNVPGWVKNMAEQFGLVASTYDEGDTLHHGGYAWDFNDPSSPNGWSPKLDQFATWLQQNMGNQTLQLIHSNPQTGQKWGIAAGQAVGPGTQSPGYYSKDWGGHADHVHWATDQPVIINPRGGPAAGMPGAPAAAPSGWHANWDAIAKGESSGNWSINTGNGYFGGLQILQSTWDQFGGRQFSVRPDLATKDQQISIAERILAGQGPGAWPNTFVGAPKLFDSGVNAGPLPTGTTLVQNNTGQSEQVYTAAQHANAQQALQTVAAQQITTTTQPNPGGDQAQHMQQPAGPQQPQSAPASVIPNPGGNAPNVVTPTPTGGTVAPSLAAHAVAPAPSNLDHNLKAIDTGIDSAASAIGQAASTAIGIAASVASAAGSSGFSPGGSAAGAFGAIGPYVDGLIREGGKVVKDVVNVPSSFLVGNITGGTQDLAYGAPLRPAQNNPNVAQNVTTNVTNISGNYELRAAMDAQELRQQQDHQAALAAHPRNTP
ncbi:transglycosylase family protein [Mycobacterium sp. 050272]|uniref:transglycosylase family protein n=1 Tax=Mycobacterium sp. 050272 TaxID=3142488 RepID=UPI0031980624